MKTIYKKLLLILLILPFSALAQSTLEGVVLDSATKQPIPGVNVVIQGSATGTSTDFDGKFKLTNLKNGDNLVFSFIGYQSQTISFANQKNVSISLVEETNQLQEVVVQVGYGSVKKKDATGSIDVITSKDFNKGAIISADQLLTGKSAGVRITNNGGSPDSGINIRIRGGASLNASNNPLIVIDGVPISNDNPAGVSNPLSLINPSDIESFSVLKDASATAIYGSRASNGVIIITTKKGTKGDVKFNYSSYVTIGKVGKTIDVMNGKEFTKFIQDYHPEYTNLLGIDDPSSAQLDDPSTPDVIEGRLLSDTNWQDAIYRTSFSTDHNISARANLYGNIPFRASLGYNKSEGLVKTNDYQRFTYSLKLSPTYLQDHLKIDVNAKGILTDKNATDDGGAIGGSITMDPTKPIYDQFGTGRFGKYYQGIIPQSYTNPETGQIVTSPFGYINGQSNPLALLEQRTRPERALRFLGNIEFDYKMHFLPELRAVINLGLDATRSRIRETFSDNSVATYQYDQTVPISDTSYETNYVFNPGKNYLENQTTTNTTWDSYLMYAKELKGFINKFDIQGGYTYQNFKGDGNKENYRYNSETGIREVNFNPNNPNNRYYNELNLQSFFGRSNIDFAGKYLVTLSFRADGSSLFLKDKRWGYFPAAAVAWKLKEESFLKNSKAINDMKLRLGYGKTGQQNITDLFGFYPSTPLFALGSNTSQYLDGANLYSAKAYNPNLTWEKTTTYNVGLDFDLFKNGLISGAFDVYKRKTTDLLAITPLPPGQFLINQFTTNVAETDSKGFELNLNIKPIQTDNVNLEFNGNIAYNYTEVASLGSNITTISASNTGLPIQTGVSLGYHTVGEQPISAYVYEQVYNTDGTPIYGAYVDRNGDNEITNADRYYKPIVPNWTYGFGFNFNYKNWDLSSSFRGQLGGQVYNASIIKQGYVDRAIPVNNNSLSNVLNFYSGAADASLLNVQQEIPFSDYFLNDATFLRCENIVLGYKFNKFYKTSSLRVYGAINNAFILTKYKGQDPENFGGIDNNFYPRPKMYTFGLSLDF